MMEKLEIHTLGQTWKLFWNKLEDQKQSLLYPVQPHVLMICLKHFVNVCKTVLVLYMIAYK